MKKGLLFVILFLVMFLYACSETQEDRGIFFNFKNEEELLSFIEKESQGLSYDYRNDVIAEDSVGEEKEASAPDHSETNVEYDGVDEGDIIKATPEGVYLVCDNILYFVDKDGERMGEVQLEKEFHFDEIYITDEKIYVIGENFFYFNFPFREGIESNHEKNYNYSKTLLTTVDRESLKISDNLFVSGSKIGTRMIKENIYIFTSDYRWNREDGKSILPFYNLNRSENKILPNSVYHLENSNINGFTTFWTYNVENKKVSNLTFLGTFWNNQISIDERGIYASKVFYENRSVDFDDAVSNWWGYREKSKMLALHFDDEGVPFIFDVFEFKGRVLNQFSIDKYEGHLRFATTEGWGESLVNRLYIFQKTENEYRKVSLIDEGLGKPRESIRSVRFDGHLATVVTFEIIDPFYVIDLTNPATPEILGELEITGFSTYQHHWKNDLVLGVGYETDDRGIINGIKISLYDISDKFNPVEAVSPFVIERQGWSHSEALFNHRALLVMEERNLIGFSVNDWKWNEGKYQFVSKYYLLEISEDEIKEKTTFTTGEIFGENHNGSIKRVVRVGENLFVFSSFGVSVHDREGEIINVFAFK